MKRFDLALHFNLSQRSNLLNGITKTKLIYEAFSICFYLIVFSSIVQLIFPIDYGINMSDNITTTLNNMINKRFDLLENSRRKGHFAWYKSIALARWNCSCHIFWHFPFENVVSYENLAFSWGIIRFQNASNYWHLN